MNTIMNIMTVALTVLSIDKDKHSATIKYGLGEPGTKGYEENILEDVYITGLTKYRFQNDVNEKFVIGKEYISENNSKDYEKCPIKLTRTCGHRDGRLMFCLSVVNEGKTERNIFSTPNGNKVESRTFTTIPPSKWLRYSDFYDRNKKAFLERKRQEREQLETAN